MDAVVLAGGLGTRLQSVVRDVPKPMAPVADRPFLERLLEYWLAQGVRRFVISVGYLAERITDYFGSSWRGAEIQYAHERSPLGTGGGLLLALEDVRSEDVLLLNGDTFFAVDLVTFARFHRERRADCSVALFASEDLQRYLGIELGADGQIGQLGVRSASGRALVNGGVYLFRVAALRDGPWRAGDRLSLEADILPWGLSSGWAMYGSAFDGGFIDIGVPEDYRRAPTVLGCTLTLPTSCSTICAPRS
jgi:D-glycero-alpha-D-manno-heptose 1-phosphate guanylyltransferase